MYLNPTYGALCKKISQKLPSKLECVFLANSGSEANDLAALMSRLYTKNHTILALNGAYHGTFKKHIQLVSIKYIFQHEGSGKMFSKF